MRGTTVLLADADESARKELARLLLAEHFEVIECSQGEHAIRALRTHSVDALITDLRLPVVTGMELIDRALKLAPDAAIIVVAAHSQVETAVEAMKKGVREFICKPVVLEDVVFRLKRLLVQDRESRENHRIREQIRRRHDVSVLVGQSPAVVAIREAVERTAQTMSNVLICGEPGVGKELTARMIHYAGVTSDKPFVAVNCVGLNSALAEREFLGYRRGAFTDAESDRLGHLEAANGGTLFLDEVANLPLHCQAVLVRAIEQQSVVRAGESRRRPIHLRVVAATSRDLALAVEKNEFREDLYYRLDVIRIQVPPLRDRSEDIPWFAQYFLEKYNEELKTACPGFTGDALLALARHPWRGNVRELENLIERALIANNGRVLDIIDLFPDLIEGNGHAPTTWNLRSALRAFEKRHIVKTLDRFGNNKIETARALGIGVSSLYRRLDELGILKKARPEAATEHD